MKEYYNQINTPKEKKLHSGFDAVSNSFIGRVKNLFLNTNQLKKDAQIIFDLSLEYSKLTDEQIDLNILEFRTNFRLNKISDLQLIEAFALAVEIGFRELDKRAYVVQIMGALALVKKFIIEMSTGEGKTMTASVAGVILGWIGKPVHILTSNDYLASRDALLLTKFYNRAQLSVASVVGETPKENRCEIYKSDIIYSTSKEILADFLKDRMLEEKGYGINNFLVNKIANKDVPSEYVLRGLDTVIVDEADSVLADDAVTPLIISTTQENKILKESVQDAYNIAKYLEKDIHYKVHEKFNDITFTKSGLAHIELNIQSLTQVWRSKQRREFLVQQSLIARELYTLNKHYIIREEKVVIVDEKTGRIMSERSWGNGLHQAIEVKENLEITDPTVTFSKMSFQRFFRLYNHLCGMSGTLQNLKNEFWQIYGTQTITIPQRVPSKMMILKDRIYLTQEQKEDALVEYIQSLYKKRVPILVGITTIKDSESLSNKLKSLNIECTLLNALNDDIEAQIIQEAGRLNKITIATNMAGRGTDIHIPKEINILGGLHVITTQRDKSRRIDLQFFGRCARQGQNGTAVSFLALDDSILDHYTPSWLHNFLSQNFKNKKIQDISILLYIYYQKMIEKDISKLRNKTLLREFSMDDSMSYT